MKAKKQYLTAQGLAELKKEYDDLVHKKRPEVVSQLTTAREMGDLSENAQYQAARDELSFMDDRISELEELLKQVSVIDDSKKTTGVVSVGSTVTVTNGKEEKYRIVGEWEADPRKKKISDQSPLGKALLGKKIGEKAVVAAPSGKIEYTIKAIE